MRRLTNKEAANRVYEKTLGKFTLVSDYKCNSGVVKVRCNDCNTEYDYEFATVIKRKDKCQNCNKVADRLVKLNNFKDYVKETTKGEYVVLDDSYYISSGKPTINMKHVTCGNEYKVCTNAFKMGQRCPYCNGNRATVKDTDWFEGKLRELIGDEYKLVKGQAYKNTHEKLLIEHTLCGNVEGYAPQDFINKHRRCHKCKLSLEKDRNFDDSLQRITGGEYRLAKDSHYITAKTSIMCHHSKCDKDIPVIPDNFSHGSQCIICSNQSRRDDKWIFDKVKSISNNNFKVVGTPNYKNNLTKFNVKCMKCGYINTVNWANFKRHQICAMCGKGKRYNTTDVEYYIDNTTNGEYKLDNGQKYMNNSTKLSIHHNKCGESFMMDFNHFWRGERCSCEVEPRGERFIRYWLDNKKIYYEPQKVFNDLFYIDKLSFDFYIPSLSLLIEMQGRQHFEPSDFGNKDRTKQETEDTFIIQTIRDSMKREYCKNNKINLLTISYKDCSKEKIDKLLDLYYWYLTNKN